MGKFLRAGIAGIALALIFGSFAVSGTNAQIISEILRRMDARSKSLLSLKADLRMIKDDPQVDETDTLKGAITVLPQTGKRVRYARIDWETPRAESIAIRGEYFESYVPAIKTITTGKAAPLTNGGGLLDLLTLSRQRIKENYVIYYLGREQIAGKVETWHLRLIPNDTAKNRTRYGFMDIWVDGDGMPLQVTESGKDYYVRPVNPERFGLTRAVMAMVKRTEDETGVKINCDIEPVFESAAAMTTLRISNLRKNVTVEGSIFKINTPKGTRVIKG